MNLSSSKLGESFYPKTKKTVNAPFFSSARKDVINHSSPRYIYLTTRHSVPFGIHLSINKFASLKTTLLSPLNASNSATNFSNVSSKSTFSPPTVSETKHRLLDKFRKPLPGLYNEVLEDLLVQVHFIRYHRDYKYNELFALGLVSLFNLIFEPLDPEDRARAFNAFVSALGEDPEVYLADAAWIESAASAISSADELVPDPAGSQIQRLLLRLSQPSVAVIGHKSTSSFSATDKVGTIEGNSDLGKDKLVESVSSSSVVGKYNKVWAVGLFRILDAAGVMDPNALKKLAEVLHVSSERVSKDLRSCREVLLRLFHTASPTDSS